MTKHILSLLCSALLAMQAHAQFIPGQVLGAAALNAALASPTILGGSINGAPIGQTTPKAVNATSLGLVGAGSGTISVLPQSAAGTYNFNLPTTAGASGSILTSAGGGSAPMTWSAQSALSVGVAAAATTSPTTTSAAFYPTFVGSASAGNQSLYTSGNLSYNPGTGVFTAPWLSAPVVEAYSTVQPNDNAAVRASRVFTLPTSSGSFATGVSSYVYSGASAYDHSAGLRGFAATVNSVLNGYTGILTGIQLDIQKGGGDATNMRGVSASLSNQSAGATITNMYGSYIDTSSNVGTVTNTYGYYAGPMTGGTRTNTPYSFYASDDTARNSFAGITLFPNATEATSTTTGAVQITGGLAIAKSLYVGNAIGVTQTITSSATTGNQTINKAAGTVNFAPGASAITVTNSLVSTASTVYCSMRSNDATGWVKNCVPSAGSFAINLGSAATATASVGFLVIN